MTGTFNPVHKGHIASMEIARDYLEKNHGYQVTKVFVSPSHEDYLQHKKARSSATGTDCDRRIYFSGEDRIKMLELALSSSSLCDIAHVDRYEIDETKFITHTEVCTHIEQRESRPVVFVAGADLAKRCRGWTAEFAVCVVGRKDEKHHTEIHGRTLYTSTGRVILRENREGLRFVCRSNDTDISCASSSAVARGQLDYLPDAVKELYCTLSKKYVV